jgi:hypothetical protein
MPAIQPYIHRGARLATVPRRVTRKGGEPPFWLTSPPHTGPGGLREAPSGAGLRLRLLADRLPERDHRGKAHPRSVNKLPLGGPT